MWYVYLSLASCLLIVNCYFQKQVCGLKWSPDGTTLASGGNDNLLNIWDARQSDQARFALPDHQAAVKYVVPSRR